MKKNLVHKNKSEAYKIYFTLIFYCCSFLRIDKTVINPITHIPAKTYVFIIELLSPVFITFGGSGCFSVSLFTHVNIQSIFPSTLPLSQLSGT